MIAAGLSFPMSGCVSQQQLVVAPPPAPARVVTALPSVINKTALAGQTIMVTGSPWDAEAHEPWQAAMHSFEWLRDLRAVGGDAARRHARRCTSPGRASGLTVPVTVIVGVTVTVAITVMSAPPPAHRH